MRFEKLGEKTLHILEALYQKGELTLIDLAKNIPITYPASVYRLYYNQAYNLKKIGYLKVKKQKNSNKSFFQLTPKGKLAILKYLHLQKTKTGKWDKKWRVIIFDIPEDKKKIREYLRRELITLGFVLLQQSVYITPYPITGDLDQMLHQWRTRKYFRYLTVSEIDDERELKEIFGLD